jgi:hypothetical protein
MIEIFLITFICVFIVDISGFIDEVETMLGKWLKGKVRIPKPFSCSLCLSWWINLIYLLCIGKFTLGYIALVALFAILTPVISTIIIAVRESVIMLIEWHTNALNE